MFDAMDNHSWDEAQQLVMRAYELYENGEFSDALSQLEEAIDINPDNASCFFNAGLTLDAMDHFKGAIAAYEQALKLKPDDPEIMNSLAVDYTRIGQYDLAIHVFEKIESIAPDFEPCFCNRIITYAEMDQHEKAEHMFYLAQQINPDCPICFYNIGNSLFSRRQFKRAIWCWKKTAEIEPTHPQINYRIAQAYWADGETEQARHYFLEEIRKNPGDIDVIQDYGLFLLECGMIGQAREKFNWILDLNPTYAGAHLYIGEILMHQGNTEKALEQFDKAVELNCALPGPRYRKAQIALDEGDRQEAERLLCSELKLGLEDPDVLISIGSMFMKLGKFDYAMDCFLKVVDESPGNSRAFYYMGKTLSMQDEVEGAVYFFEHAIDLELHDAGLYTDTARLYLDRGELMMAEKFVKKALDLAGTEDDDINRLAGKIKLAKFACKLKTGFARIAGDKIRLIWAKYRCRLRTLIHVRDK